MTREQFETIIYEAYENNVPASPAEHKIESIKAISRQAWENVKDEAWTLYRASPGAYAISRMKKYKAEEDVRAWLFGNENLWLFEDGEGYDEGDPAEIELAKEREEHFMNTGMID